MSIFVYKKEVPAVGSYCPVLELHCLHGIKLKKLCQTDRYYTLQLVSRNKFKSYLIFMQDFVAKVLDYYAYIQKYYAYDKIKLGIVCTLENLPINAIYIII